MHVELTDQGYLHLPAVLSQCYFPNDTVVVFVKGAELWLLPTRGAGGGGLLLKQRNRQGDRSVLIWELLPPNTPSGDRAAIWDENQGALRVMLL